MSSTHWHRNLFAVTAANFVAYAGFTLAMPFLPLYIQQMGVHDEGQVAWWTGVSLGVTPALVALCGPFWGRMADRFGSKKMVIRAFAAFATGMAAMAFVTAPWQFFALRALIGLVGGYATLMVSMAAQSAPPEKLAQAIGLVQTAQRLGPAIGPVIGGALASVVGLRNAFLVSAAAYAAAVVVVWLLYTESPSAEGASRTGRARVPFRRILAFENFVLLMAVIFGLQFADRSFGPVLPLWVARSMAPSAVPFVSGVLFSVMAVAAAAGHHSCSRLLRLMPTRIVVAATTVMAACGVALLAATTNVALLIVAMTMFGVGVGAATTASYTAAGMVVPREVHATAFGLLTSASLVGLATSPVISGFVAAVSLRAVFLLDAVLLVALAVVVRRVMVETPVTIEAPTTEEV